MAAILQAITADEWMIQVCESLGIPADRASRIMIEGIPGEPLIVTVDLLASPTALTVALPTVVNLTVNVDETGDDHAHQG